MWNQQDGRGKKASTHPPTHTHVFCMQVIEELAETITERQKGIVLNQFQPFVINKQTKCRVVIFLGSAVIEHPGIISTKQKNAVLSLC